MTIKHRLKLFFASFKKKKKDEVAKKKPDGLVLHRDMTKDDSVIMFLEKELHRLKLVMSGFNDKTNEVSAYRAVVKERVDTINWMIDNIYGKEQRSRDGSDVSVGPV